MKAAEMGTRTSPAPSILRASSLALAASTAICTGLKVAFDLSNLTDAGQRILKLYLHQTWRKPATAAEWLSKLQAREESPNQ
jgi:hypothetical protein